MAKGIRWAVDVGCCARTGGTLTGGGARSALKEVNCFDGCGGIDCEVLTEGEGGVGRVTGTEASGGPGWATGVEDDCGCRRIREGK